MISVKSDLAPAAERGDGASRLDLADPMSAARTRLSTPEVDSEEVTDLRLESRRDSLTQDR